MASLSKVRARCETARKDGARGTYAVCVWKSLCGPVPTEMMDDVVCAHNLLTLRLLH